MPRSRALSEVRYFPLGAEVISTSTLSRLAADHQTYVFGFSARCTRETDAGRLSKVDPATGEVTVIADGLAVGLPADGGGPPTWVALSSVAVSESGDLYLTGDVANVIYRIPR